MNLGCAAGERGTVIVPVGLGPRWRRSARQTDVIVEPGSLIRRSEPGSMAVGPRLVHCASHERQRPRPPVERVARRLRGGQRRRRSADARPSGSVFTQILGCGLDDDETNIVHRGATCFVIMNAFPYTSGHVMVLPYREVADLEQLDADEFTELWATVTAPSPP